MRLVSRPPLNVPAIHPASIPDMTTAHRELHVYRGHQPSPTGFIMGHEFVGTVVQAGSEVQSVSVGDKVVTPFTVSW